MSVSGHILRRHATPLGGWRGARRLTAAVSGAALVAAMCVSSAWADDDTREQRVSIDVRDARLLDLTLRFSELTGQNFVLLDSDLEDHRITIYAPHPVTIDEARELFVAALRLSGLDVQETGAYWKIDRVN